MVENGHFIAPQRLFLTVTGDVVGEDHPDRDTLLAPAGGKISLKEAKRLGILTEATPQATITMNVNGLKEVQAELESVRQALADAVDENTRLNTLIPTDDEIIVKKWDVADAQGRIEELEKQLGQANKTIAGLQKKVADLTVKQKPEATPANMPPVQGGA